MNDYDQNDDRGFFEKYGIAVVLGVVLLLIVGVGVGVYWFAGKIPPPHKPDEIMVRLLPASTALPPPPPPPPPPKIPPPPPSKRWWSSPKSLNRSPSPKPKSTSRRDLPARRPAGLHRMMASAAGGGGDGGDIGGGGGNGSKFGWYAAEVQARIADALRQNSKTRGANLRLKVRIWSDSSGRITRAELSGSSGDPAVDAAIKNEVLVGLKLQEPPPQDMPMPIVMMIREQRPG